ncbi:iron transporter [Vibrio cholerae]|nr:iron transporter [Vibrio cholerae]EGR4403737.1 iron transporter [Vibrio cholerae]
MVTAAVFEFCGVRCQPLRRALGIRGRYETIYP